MLSGDVILFLLEGKRRFQSLLDFRETKRASEKPFYARLNQNSELLR
jgi:hypothetical protein